jgi:ABC-2 type transport system permease protein
MSETVERKPGAETVERTPGAETIKHNSGSETMTATPTVSVRRTPPSASRRVRAALAAEWIKVRSLRSMLGTLVLAAVFCIGQANLVCSNYVANWPQFDAARRAGFEPLDTNLQFVQLGILFFGVFGALVVTNEYGNGLIRSTFAATPQRGLVLAAKTALLGLIALVAAAAICFTAVLTGQSVLAPNLPHVTLGDPGVLGQILGTVLYLTATGLIGVFVGVLARGTALAMGSLFGLFLVLPIMLDALPKDSVWRHTVPYLPTNLGTALWHSHVEVLPSPTTAALLLGLYVVVFGTAAAFSLRGRDA